jgi:hypothetical protein
VFGREQNGGACGDNGAWLSRVFGKRGLRNTRASLGAGQFGQRRKNREGALIQFVELRAKRRPKTPQSAAVGLFGQPALPVRGGWGSRVSQVLQIHAKQTPAMSQKTRRVWGLFCRRKWRSKMGVQTGPVARAPRAAPGGGRPRTSPGVRICSQGAVKGPSGPVLWGFAGGWGKGRMVERPVEALHARLGGRDDPRYPPTP